MLGLQPDGQVRRGDVRPGLQLLDEGITEWPELAQSLRPILSGRLNRACPRQPRLKFHDHRRGRLRTEPQPLAAICPMQRPEPCACVDPPKSFFPWSTSWPQRDQRSPEKGIPRDSQFTPDARNKASLRPGIGERTGDFLVQSFVAEPIVSRRQAQPTSRSRRPGSACRGRYGAS